VQTSITTEDRSAVYASFESAPLHAITGLSLT